MSNQLKTYLDKQIKQMWSSLVSVEQVTYHERLHFKVVSKLIWYKVQFYAKFTLIRLPSTIFRSSQFFNCFPLKQDEIESIGDDIVFYKYAIIQQSNHIHQSSCKNVKLQYQPKDIYKKLREENELLFKYVDISYSHYQYQLLKFPLPLKVPFSLKDIAGIAQSQKVLEKDCQLQQYFGEKRAKIINMIDVNKLLKHKGRVDKLIGHSHRFIVNFSDAVFVKQYSTVFYLRQMYEKEKKQHNKTTHTTQYDEQFFPDGKQFQGLFLLGFSQKPFGLVGLQDKFARLLNNQLSDLQILANIFSKKLSRCKTIYRDTSEEDFNKVFRQFSIKNQGIETIEKVCEVGDLLYIDRKMYHHVGAYLGADLIIHVSVGTFSGVANQKATRYDLQNQLTGKLFQFDSFENFVEDQEKYEMEIRRLYFCPFTKEEILEEAMKMRQELVTYDPHERNCEHLAVELMTGKAYSSQAGILSFLIKPIVKAGLYNVSW